MGGRLRIRVRSPLKHATPCAHDIAACGPARGRAAPRAPLRSATRPAPCAPSPRAHRPAPRARRAPSPIALRPSPGARRPGRRGPGHSPMGSGLSSQGGPRTGDSRSQHARTATSTGHPPTVSDLGQVDPAYVALHRCLAVSAPEMTAARRSTDAAPGWTARFLPMPSESGRNASGSARRRSGGDSSPARDRSARTMASRPSRRESPIPLGRLVPRVAAGRRAPGERGIESERVPGGRTVPEARMPGRGSTIRL